MSQCYLGSESKTSMTKLYFEVFIANYFYTFNKKDPVDNNVFDFCGGDRENSENNEVIVMFNINK